MTLPVPMACRVESFPKVTVLGVESSVGVKPGVMWDHMKCGSRINGDSVLSFCIWLEQQVCLNTVD